MITLLLVYYVSTGAMHTVEVSGFRNKERCELAMGKVVSDVENAAEILSQPPNKPLGWLLISAHCLEK